MHRDVGWRMSEDALLWGGGKRPGVRGEELRGGGTVSCLHLRTRQRCQPGCPGHRDSVPRQGLQEGFCKRGAGSSPPRLSCWGAAWLPQPVLPHGQLRRGARCVPARPAQLVPSPAPFPGALAAATLLPAAPCPACLSFPLPSTAMLLASTGEALLGLAEQAGKPGRAMLASSKNYE